MMIEWNQALQAYDAEYEVLEGLREEYVAFLKTRFERSAARFAEVRSDRPWSAKMTSDDAPWIEWVARPREGSPVGIWFWAGRPHGAEASGLRVGLCLDDESGSRNRDQRILRKAALVRCVETALRSLPGESRDPTRHSESAEGVLRIAQAALDDQQASEILADHAVAFAEVGSRIDEILQLCAWLGDSLKPLLGSKLPSSVPADVSWQSDRLQPWAGGWYVEIDREPEHYVWICARPPGELLLGHHNRALHATICKRLGATPMLIDGEDSQIAVIMTEHHARALRDQMDAEAVRARALEVFTAYFELVGR